VDRYLWLFNGHEVLVFLEHGCRRGMSRGKSNSFASGWMFRLFEEAILGALCGSHGRWI
jgi:hypothetical protein